MKKIYPLIFFIILLYANNISAQITGSDTVCSGEKVTYNVPPGAGSYSWNITGGTILNGTTTDSLVVQWGPAGPGTISVTINSPNSTPFLNIVIHPKPTPMITHVPYLTCPHDTGNSSLGGQPDHRGGCEKVCKLSTITYCTSLNAGSTYQWFISGGLIVVGANTNCITVTWDSTINGSLVVYETNQWGCIDSSEICVEKVNLPVAFFTHQATVCKFSQVFFNNLSTGATSYQWYFGDGGSLIQAHPSNPSHAYSNAGTYTITLIAENNCHCTDTFQSVITVDSLPGPTITCPSTLCAFDTATYSTASGTGCIYNWFALGGTIIGPNNQPNVTVAWGAGQIGTLGLVVSGCVGVCSDTTLVYIPIVPSVATISGANKVCPGDCETYTLPHFSGATYHWSLNSGACGTISDSTNCEKLEICWPNLPFACNDTLNVSFYDSFLHCGGTGQFIIRVRPRLEILGNTTVCANAAATLFSSNSVVCFWSISPTGPILSPSPAPAITINWLNTPGNYVVKAWPQNPNQACNDTAFVNIKVVAPPAAPVITGDTIVCQNSSVSYCTTASGPVNWIITGGTPLSAIGNCITVTWGNTPPFIVRAFQQMPNSPYCTSDTTTQNVLLASATPPVVTGSLLGCANSNSSFGCSNCNLFPAGTTYSWSVNPNNAGAVIGGQGTSSATVQWGNNAPQNVTVTLTAVVCGTPLSNSITVSLNPAPTPSVIQIGNLCAGGTAQLQATGGAYVAYNWSGPAFSSVANPVTISLAGLYQVTVTDVNTCTALSQKTVQYVGGPNASISTLNPLGYCIGSVYTVTMCALGNGTYSYAWSNAATSQCISVSAPGNFQVTVTDANSCTAFSNILVVHEDSCNGTGTPCIPGPGSVSFTNSGCNPVTFTNTSVGASSFSWSFGDLSNSNLVSPVHAYTQAGFYVVVLSGYVPNNTGTDSCLLQDTAQIEIPLAADFDFVSGCNGTPVCFTDKSTFTFGNNISIWSWNFGDANTSNAPSPCHTYSGPGTYIVTLTISNGPCSTFITDTVVIPNPPTAAFTFSNPNCINQPVNFTDASFSLINYWSWTFDDGGTSLNQNPSHTYALPGTYSDTLIVHNTSGCYDTVVNSVTVVAPSLSGNISAFPDTIVCAGTNVLLVAPSCGTCTYLWSNGSTNDSITVSTTGIYSVTIVDANGCPYTTSIKIIVNNGPPAIITNGGSADLCLGDFTFLSTTYNIKWTYYWISNDGVNNGNTSSTISVNPLLTGTYTYQVAITDTSTGCSDTSLVTTIVVHPVPLAPTITALGPSTICDGDTVILVATHPDPTVTFLWNTGEVNDTISVTKNGCYEVQVTDTNGCKKKTTYCVTVNPLPELCSFYDGCYDTCAPYTICAPIGSTYQWLNNGIPISGDTLQCLTTSNSGNYSVIVSNSYGCIDTTGVLNLTLYPCPDSLCADLTIDSAACDSNGHYILFYHVSNESQIPVTQVNLEILSPHLNVAYAPVVSFISIPSGGTSPQLTAVIYNAQEGDSLCFRSHISVLDSMGEEQLCCYSDTDCVVLPPCPEDSLCCSFNYRGDSVWCEAGPIGTTLHFKLRVNGCGTLQIQTGQNTSITGNNPLVMTGNTAVINGTYTPASPSDTVVCITLVMGNGVIYCADSTICLHFHCDTVPPRPVCDLHFEDSICVGQTTAFNYAGNPAGLTFNWQFINGSPSTATGPGPHYVTYNIVGCHQVICIINNNMQGTLDCVDTICIVPPPVASVQQTGNTLFAYPAGYSYQWYTGNPGANPIAGAVNQFYNPSITGFYCVVVSNGANCSDTACIDHIPNSIDEISEEQWNIFPNPNDGSFTLSLIRMKKELLEMKITDALGQVVDIRNLESKVGKQEFYIANGKFAKGIYFVQLKTEQGVGLKKMIVR